MNVLNMDCVKGMRLFPDASFDSIVTDPPYELGFMGKGWDATGIANNMAMWAEALRVLKPGGHLLAFSGSRTYHRMVCAIEDAGFEIRDQIMWVYGSGFPKSLDVSKAIDKDAPETTDAARQWQGWGTALKPAHEPIVVARKPLIGTVAANVLAHGTGAINVDGCRVAHLSEVDRESATPQGKVVRNNFAPGSGVIGQETERPDTSLGRWPANLIHDGSDEVLAAFPQAGGAQAPVTGNEPTGHGFSGAVYGHGGVNGRQPSDRRDGAGSAARFFYCAKASRADRNDGCEALPEHAFGAGNQAQAEIKRGNVDHAGSSGMNTVSMRANHHPTVKPTELMRYLVRLVTPPGGIVMDPFTGSGSTGRAAVLEGFGFIGFELDPAYCAIATARISGARK